MCSRSHPERRRWTRIAPALVLACAVRLAVVGTVAAQQPDTTLFALIHSKVLAESPEIAAARADLALALGRLGATGHSAPAVLSAEVEEVPGGLRIHDAGSTRVTVEKTFLSGGQRSAARSVAAAEVRDAEVRLEAMQRIVIARTDVALVRAIGWAAIADELVDQDSLLSSAEGSLRARFAVAQASYVDVLRLRTERLRIQTSLSQALAEAAAAHRSIEATLPPGAPTARAALSQAADFIETAPAGALVRVLPRPPDVDSLLVDAGIIRAAEAEVRRARAQRELVAALQRPQLAAGVGGQRFRADDGSKPVGVVLTGSISLPFTARSANRSSAAAADLQIRSAEAKLVAARATTRAALLAARERYQAALDRVGFFDPALLQAASAEREAALGAYRSGRLSLTELLDFERGLSAAQAERIQSEIAAAEALGELIDGAHAIVEAPSVRDVPATAGGGL